MRAKILSPLTLLHLGAIDMVKLELLMMIASLCNWEDRTYQRYVYKLLYERYWTSAHVRVCKINKIYIISGVNNGLFEWKTMRKGSWRFRFQKARSRKIC